MLRIITPIVLAALALFIFFGPTQPILDEIKTLSAHQADLDEALGNARAIKEVRDGLQEKYNNFPQSDKDRLDKLLPDTVDNVKLIIDINAIAGRRGMILKDIVIENKSEEEAKTGITPAPAVNPDLNSLTLSFSVVGSYENLRGFLIDLEKSLRLVEIENISFNTSVSAPTVTGTSYKATLRTYWLKEINI